MRRTREQRLFTLCCLAPAFILFVTFVAAPGVRALLLSLQKWSGLDEPQWVGLSNFEILFADPLFYAALRHNVILMVGAGSVTMVLALFFANLLHRGVRGAGVFRVTFFFPNVLAAVAVAVLWLLLYSQSEFGVFNTFLLSVQEQLARMNVEFMPDRLPIAFTDSSRLIYALIPMMIWMTVGFYMVLFLAAMESVPTELYEAATIDGATGAQQFWHVTLPMIREVLVVGIVFFIISAAKFFDPVWVLENSYPTAESHVLSTVLYQKVFSEYNVGYAAAVAVVLFVLVLLATMFTLRWQRREALEF